MGGFSGGGGGLGSCWNKVSCFGYKPAPQVSLFCFRLRRKFLRTAMTRTARARMMKPATIPAIAPPERPLEVVEAEERFVSAVEDWEAEEAVLEASVR